MINGKRLLALCTSRIYDPQIHGFIKNLNETLKKENCALLVFTINSDIYWDESLRPAETFIYDLMPYDDLDCVMIMDEKIKSHTISSDIIRRSKENNVPVVIIDGKYEGTTCINFDYAQGFEAMVRHIIEDHHAKDPHMMAGLPHNYFSDQRIEIFKKVLAENNIPFDDSRISYGDFWADPTIEATLKLLMRDHIPDAVICANDIMALNVRDVLKSAGYSIPKDVIVSGFDGFDEIFFSTPKISSVSCDTIHLSEAAAEAVKKIINGEPVSDEYIVPYLMPNESCGCPDKTWHDQTILSRFNDSFYRHQDDVRILYNISSSMETSLTIWDMAASIHNHKTKNIINVVDWNIFNTETNYFITPRTGKMNLHILNDADFAEEHRFTREPLPRKLFNDKTVNDKESVFSGNFRDRMIELLDTGFPLIFIALDYINKPMGFTCFFFKDYMITNYSKAASITTAINMGIGGFVNMQYQRYLLNKMDVMYTHDPLTGLYNRIGFNVMFDKALNENKGKPATVIMSDLDGLKYINDNFGHAEGDRAIAEVASALVEACPDYALSARFGGDEIFSVIIGDCDSAAIIKKIDDILVEFNKNADLPYEVMTSSGAFNTVLDDSFNIIDAIKVADKEMYQVKDAKRAYRMHLH